jgi:hypothetical protein
MAGNMDPNDLNGVADALEELRKGSSLSAETLAKLSSSGKDAEDAQKKLTASLKAYGQQVTAAIGGLKNGGGSFQSLSGSIDVLSTSISKVAGNFGTIGNVLGGLATGLGEAAKIALNQLDDITKNYQALGDASAVATDGIDGLYRQFNALGNYSLPAFTKAVKTNVQGISALGGTAALGAEELSKVSGVLTTGQVAQRFLKLGMSLDAVGDTTAEYLSTMSRLGLTQGSSTEELTKKTQNYIVEVDKIARLTGQTREAQQQEAQKNMADSRYRAKISQMRANGETDAAAQLELFVRGMGAMGPAFGDAARATVTGTYLTKQAAETDIVLNGAIRRNIMAIENGTMATTAIADAQEAAAQGAVQFRTQFLYGKDLGGVGQAAYDVESLLLRRKELVAEGLTAEAAVEKAQKEAMEASGELTNKITGAQLSAANASKNIQSISFSLAAVASGPLQSFANALERATGAVSRKFGIGGTYSTPAGVNRGGSGSEVDQILQTIKNRESSGGNYTAQNPVSTASGAYQFVDGTWKGLTKKYGMGQEFGKAKLAPKEIQDAVAKRYVEDILKEAGGDVSKVPLAWYTGNIQGNLGKSTITPGDPGVSEYQSKWMGDYNKQAPTGPSSRYQSGMSGFSYNSAGAGTPAPGQGSASEQESSSWFASYGKKIDEQNALLRQNNQQNAKLLQEARAK